MRQIDLADLASVVPQLDHLHVSDCQTAILPSQMNCLFNTLVEAPEKKLRTLQLFYIDLSDVSGCQLAGGVCKLQYVSLKNLNLTPVQVNMLFTMIAETEDLQLQSMFITWSNLQDISSDILTKAVSRLHTIRLINTGLSPIQTRTLIQHR